MWKGLQKLSVAQNNGHVELENNATNDHLYRIVAMVLFGATAVIYLFCSLKKKINYFNKALGVQVPCRSPAYASGVLEVNDRF